jgi:predicted PurR-regulated permease PerM
MGSILGYVSSYIYNLQNLSTVTLIFFLLFAFQSLYTLFFWITLRQFMQERFERRNTSALEDMAAPLQITVGPATRGETDIW